MKHFKIGIFTVFLLFLISGFTCQERKAIIYSVTLAECPAELDVSQHKYTWNGWDISIRSSPKDCGLDQLSVIKSIQFKALKGYQALVKVNRLNGSCGLQLAVDLDDRNPDQVKTNLVDINETLPEISYRLNLRVIGDVSRDVVLGDYNKILEWCKSH